MGYYIILSVIFFLVGMAAGAAITHYSALRSKMKAANCEQDGSCEDEPQTKSANAGEPQTKSANAGEQEFDVYDIVMQDFNFEDPFAQDRCILITDKQRSPNGVMYYAYMYCNRKGNITGNLPYSGRLWDCVKIGHKNK